MRLEVFTAVTLRSVCCGMWHHVLILKHRHVHHTTWCHTPGVTITSRCCYLTNYDVQYRGTVYHTAMCSYRYTSLINVTKVWKLSQLFVHVLTLQDAYVCDSALLCSSVRYRRHPPLKVDKFLNTAVNSVLDMLVPCK